MSFAKAKDWLDLKRGKSVVVQTIATRREEVDMFLLIDKMEEVGLLKRGTPVKVPKTIETMVHTSVTLPSIRTPTLLPTVVRLRTHPLEELLMEVEAKTAVVISTLT